MRAKEFLKPTILKILIFAFIAIFYLYFASETTCGVSLFFSFCYKAHGFPFYYMVSGDIDWADDYAKTLFFGKYFSKSGNILFNPIALLVDIIFVYLLSCLLSLLFSDMKFKLYSNKKEIKIGIKN